MRYLGIDFGLVKVGVALSDPLQIIASPLTVLKNDQNLFKNIQDILNDYQINKIIIGNPLHLNGNQSQSSQKVQQFKSELAKLTDLEIILVDERLTTTQAAKKLHEAGLSRRQQKNKIDMAAAVLILQSYLDRR